MSKRTPERDHAKYLRAREREWYKVNMVKQVARLKELRIEVLTHYSGGPPECACCGERNLEFLCIDHINGGGRAHRLEIGGGSRLTRWIIKNGFPPMFRVLCHNCNHSYGHYSYCPHQLS